MTENAIRETLPERLTKSLVDTVVESWRFCKVFERVVLKLDAGESTRYLGQYRWYVKRLDEALTDVECKIVNVEGYPYDPGMAVTPLNIDEFGTDDRLVVDQMIEPIIMQKGNVLKTGIVTLKKVEM